MKNLANILIFCLLFVWQLPQNLVALCWLPFAGRVRKIAYRNYCIALAGKMPKNASGVSLGNFAIISIDCASDERTLRHEVDGHTVDSKSLVRSTCWSSACRRYCICCAGTVSPLKNPTTISTQNVGPTATQDCEM